MINDLLFLLVLKKVVIYLDYSKNFYCR